MDDSEIPGMDVYLAQPTIADTPVNRTAFRFAVAFIQQYNTECPEGPYMAMRLLWSGTMDRAVAFVGLLVGDTYVPVMMVFQTELIVGSDMDLHCSQGCAEDGRDCKSVYQIGEEDALAEEPQVEDVSEAFAHIVESWEGDTPSYEKLAGFYNTPTSKEGDKEDEKGNP